MGFRGGRKVEEGIQRLPHHPTRVGGDRVRDKGIKSRDFSVGLKTEASGIAPKYPPRTQLTPVCIPTAPTAKTLIFKECNKCD
jgi:hypothetical protein